jgi:enoyl-CoA hydratase/carnithine racemase
MVDFETLRIREEDAVLFAQIDAAPINLLGAGLTRDLVSLIRLVDENDRYRVVVFSSANPEFFISHVDITQIPALKEAASSLTGEGTLAALLRRLSTTKAITIAQIEGRARGAGSEFALACDMRFASREKAVFGQIESGIGLVPGSGGMQHLARLMGRGRAMEVLLSADDYDADTAERYGWINRALPEAELSPFVSALAHRIAGFPQQALIDIKTRVNAITLASSDDFRGDAESFVAAASRPAVQKNMQTLMGRGMQQHGEVELHFGRILADLNI